MRVFSIFVSINEHWESSGSWAAVRLNEKLYAKDYIKSKNAQSLNLKLQITVD